MKNKEGISRRTALKASAALLGYAVVGGAASAVLNGCKADTSDHYIPVSLTEDNLNVLAELVERILPTTDTPGAKAAFVHRYIDEALKNNVLEPSRSMFIEELDGLAKRTMMKYGKPFTKIKDKERDQLVQELANDAKKTKGEHFFGLLRELTVTGYFTSEIGATQALVYDPIPGPYKGCIPFSEVGGVYSLD